MSLEVHYGLYPEWDDTPVGHNKKATVLSFNFLGFDIEGIEEEDLIIERILEDLNRYELCERICFITFDIGYYIECNEKNCSVNWIATEMMEE